jgi:hypothetical protein
MFLFIAPVSSRPVGKNSSLMGKVEGEWQESCKLTGEPQTDK